MSCLYIYNTNFKGCHEINMPEHHISQHIAISCVRGQANWKWNIPFLWKVRRLFVVNQYSFEFRAVRKQKQRQQRSGWPYRGQGSLQWGQSKLEHYQPKRSRVPGSPNPAQHCSPCLRTRRATAGVHIWFSGLLTLFSKFDLCFVLVDSVKGTLVESLIMGFQLCCPLLGHFRLHLYGPHQTVDLCVECSSGIGITWCYIL